MKLGTDAVLLGAWAKMDEALRILDAGTGCGILALMLAQNHPLAKVYAVDVHEESVAQASLNVASSSFSSRIQVFKSDMFDLSPEERFDLIVSNPPFFEGDLQAPEPDRNRARHQASEKSVFHWMKHLSELLFTDGRIATILPVREQNRLENVLKMEKMLFPEKKCCISSYRDSEFVRILTLWTKSHVESPFLEKLYLYDAPGKRSEIYVQLCADFYL